MEPPSVGGMDAGLLVSVAVLVCGPLTTLVLFIRGHKPHSDELPRRIVEEDGREPWDRPPPLCDGTPLEATLQFYPPPRREFSRRELLLDRSVNFVGAVGSWAAAAALLTLSWRLGDSWQKRLAFAVYCVGFVCMLNMSAYYHWCAWDWKRIDTLILLDLAGIDLIVMGSYAPICCQYAMWRSGAVAWMMGLLGLALYSRKAISAKVSPVGVEAVSWEWTDYVHLARHMLMGWACIPGLLMVHTSRVFICLMGSAALMCSVGTLSLTSTKREFNMFLWHLAVVLSAFAIYAAYAWEFLGRPCHHPTTHLPPPPNGTFPLAP